MFNILTEKHKPGKKLNPYSFHSSIDTSIIEVRKENILRAMEMDLSVADDYLLELITDYTRKCLSMAKLRACYSILADPRINPETSQLSLNNQHFNLSKIVASAMRKSSHLALFVGTCGEKLEKYSKQLMSEGHSLEGLIVDLVASELAEGVADYLHKKIEKEVSTEGMHVSNRYSPGYCNWPVSDQQKLFSLLGNNHCGVRLTASSLMIPIKSISGIIGIGPEVRFRGYACAKCDDAQCIYRNRK
jgi:hypothetical protein